MWKFCGEIEYTSDKCSDIDSIPADDFRIECTGGSERGMGQENIFAIPIYQTFDIFYVRVWGQRYTLKILLSLILFIFSFASAAEGNTSNDSFNKAKKMLERQVYQDHRVTLYCDAKFDANKNIVAPEGFVTTTHLKRAKKVEWEHVVPAENFGRAFSEWRVGHNECVNSKGKSFKGRKCAEKMNTEYRYMQADMHNLFPAIGAVNALRSNYNFTMLLSANTDFGSCDMRIDDRKAQPPEVARGIIARTYFYMEQSYPKYQMSDKQSQLMQAWDKKYPVVAWECERSRRIEKLQGNGNVIVISRCKKANM